MEDGRHWADNTSTPLGRVLADTHTHTHTHTDKHE